MSEPRGLDLRVVVARRSHIVDVSLRAGPETIAIIGPSGSGKSTVLRAIAGLVRPSRGFIRVAGRTWFDGAEGVDLPSERRRVGYLPQDLALFPHMTALQNVAFPSDVRRAHRLLTRFGADHLADVRPSGMSGGERRRVALARALARDPELLLLDEPTAALDPAARSAVRTHLADLIAATGLPALVVTHDLNEATVLATRIVVVVAGVVRQVAAPAEVITRPADADVARLVGANVLHGHAVATGRGRARITLEGGGTFTTGAMHTGDVAVIVQPWNVGVTAVSPPAGFSGVAVRGRVTSVTRSGDRERIAIGALEALVPMGLAGTLGLGPGSACVVLVEPHHAHVVPALAPAAAPTPPKPTRRHRWRSAGVSTPEPGP